ncbi:MAG: DUF3365 domain-containing protein [Halioglobus sp.]
MRRLILILFSVAFVGNTIADDNLQFEAQDLVNQFVELLKPQLTKAMSEGGPTRAIEVCASAAPKIADSLSAESGWTVGRVSLKSRNASRGTPDHWERTVLEQFDQRRNAGESAAKINYGETVGSQYRYMQAQGVEPLCLTCHGENLSVPVRESLKQYYPDDWATDYTLDQIRGAISVGKAL